jgi:hypothetical protein
LAAHQGVLWKLDIITLGDGWLDSVSQSCCLPVAQTLSGRMSMARNRLGVGTAVFASLLFAASIVKAQAIGGRVSDSSGAVLPGVRIEVRSPASIEQLRTAVTNGVGQYLIVELKPGTYVVTFTLPGFSTVRREGIELTTGFTAAVNAELKVGDIAETITVSAQSPVVDVQNTLQQVVLTRNVVDTIPSAQTFNGMGALIPGMVLNGSVGGQLTQDVGGQSGNDRMQLSIHGGRGGDQQVQVNGMSITSITSISQLPNYPVTDGMEELVYSVAENSAEVESGGVRTNMIPREGSNTFRDRFPRWTPENRPLIDTAKPAIN